MNWLLKSFVAASLILYYASAITREEILAERERLKQEAERKRQAELATQQEKDKARNKNYSRFFQCGISEFTDDLSSPRPQYGHESIRFLEHDFYTGWEFPWLVFLYANRTDKVYEPACSAVLIDSQWVLASARCPVFVPNPVVNVTVRFGFNLLDKRTIVEDTGEILGNLLQADQEQFVPWDNIFANTDPSKPFVMIRLPEILDENSIRFKWLWQPLCLSIFEGNCVPQSNRYLTGVCQPNKVALAVGFAPSNFLWQKVGSTSTEILTDYSIKKYPTYIPDGNTTACDLPDRLWKTMDATSPLFAVEDNHYVVCGFQNNGNGCDTPLCPAHKWIIEIITNNSIQPSNSTSA